MFVFYVLQTACFGLYSETGNLAAAHTFIGMICKVFSRLVENILTRWSAFRLVLFYAFCKWYYSRISEMPSD
jgi:hypothetical protein